MYFEDFLTKEGGKKHSFTSPFVSNPDKTNPELVAVTARKEIIHLTQTHFFDQFFGNFA